MSSPLFHLFGDIFPPPVDLVDRLDVFSFTPETLRNMMVQDTCQAPFERIFTYPLEKPENLLSPEEILPLEDYSRIAKFSMPAKFISNTLTDRETGIYIFVHAVLIYQEVVPSVVEESRDFLPDMKNFSQSAAEEEERFFVPVVLSLMTQSSYFDFFYDLLEKIVKKVQEVSNENQLLGALEIIKWFILLVDSTIVPPVNTKHCIELGDTRFEVPVNKKGKLKHFERNILVLFDCLSVENIVDLWEVFLLNNQVVLYGLNDLVIFSIIEALKQLIFPLTWNMNIFACLDDKKKDYLGCITPFIAGVNKSKVVEEELKRYTRNLFVLDIEENCLTLAGKLVLCKCRKNAILNKLRLAKLYYYTHSSRLKTYDMSHLETGVDQDFSKLVKNLLHCEEPNKAKLFGKTVKKVFFEFFEFFSKIEEFIEVELKTNSYKFNREEFLVNIRKCKNPSCSMPEFFNSLIETQSFQTYLDYYKKFDENNFANFKEITKGPKINKKFNEIHSFTVSQKMHPLALIEILLKIYLSQRVETFEFNYRIKSIETFREILINQTSQEISRFSSVFFGKFGFVRVSKILFFRATQVALTPQLKKYRPKLFETETWHGTLLKTLYKLKYHRKDQSKLLKILSVFQDLNTQDSPIFPSFHLALVIQSLESLGLININSLLACRGHIAKVVKRLAICKTHPNSVYKLISNNTINRESKIHSIYSNFSFLEHK